MSSPWRGVGLVLLCTGAFLAGNALAQTGGTPRCREDFETADRNRDGRLDREEFHQRVVEQFFLLDRGKKGYLLVDEIMAVSTDAFKAANRKADGKLSLQEFVNARFVDFVAADRNQDGSLTIEEIRAYEGC